MHQPSLGSVDSRPSVVLVDDAEEVASALGDFLSTSGVQAVIAFRADDALEAIRRDPAVTVLVSDVRMPGKDGFTLAREVQALRGEDTAIEIVLITAHASQEGVASAAKGQIFEFLEKPFRPHRLAETVRRAHEKATSRRGRAVNGARGDAAADGGEAPATGQAGGAEGAVSGAGRAVTSGEVLQMCASAMEPMVLEAGLSLSVGSGARDLLAPETDLALLTRALGAIVKEAVLLSPRGATIQVSARRASEGIEFTVESARAGEVAMAGQRSGRSNLLAEAADMARRLAAHLVVRSTPATTTTPYKVCLVVRAAGGIDRPDG